jgi:hypothetical protein
VAELEQSIPAPRDLIGMSFYVVTRRSRSVEPASRRRSSPSDTISCLGARQLLDHALAGPLPLLQEDQEIGHLLPVRPLVEPPDEVGADIAGGGQDPNEIPTRRWTERVSEASRVLPKHRGASVSAACPGELPTSSSTASRSSRRVGL